MFKRLTEDIDAYMARDPAAHSRLMVVFGYPGLHATWWHRLSHAMWRRRWRLAARLVSHLGRWLTGIEIHPGAVVGRRFVIDHGMGVVIGETAEIGDDVTLYHDVTLGGIAPAVDSANQRNVKRHPTLCDGVIIGSGAQILGPITVCDNARVGANAVVVKDVPEGATAVGVPARLVRPKSSGRTDEFAAYGMPTEDLPDPIARAIEGLLEQVTVLRARVVALEQELESTTAVPAESEESRAARTPQPPAGDPA